MNIPGLDGSGGGGGNLSNAFANYENEVTKTAASDGDFKAKLLGSIKGLLAGLTSFLSGKIAQLNELLKGKLFSFNLPSLKKGGGYSSDGIDNILGKLSGSLSGYLDNSVKTLQAMGTDAVRQMTNAAQNYLSNIAEDYINNLKSAIYIGDVEFLATLKGLYYAGADLAYSNHYIRTQCLTRDWSKTLEFIDKEYGVKYNKNYKQLVKDLEYCAFNSCHKNLFYIYKSLYKELKEYKSLLLESDRKLASIMKETNYKELEEYEIERKLNEMYKKDSLEIEKMMVYYMKCLIVNSYTYTRPNDLRKFFTAYGDILKPKYFGDNDDKYNNEYTIKKIDCDRMLPFFQQHTKSKSDIQTSKNIKEQAKKLEDYNNKLTANTKELKNDIMKNRSERDRAKVKTIIQMEESRNKALKAMNDRSTSLANAALNRGSRANAKDSRAKEPIQTDLKTKVKYREKDVQDYINGALVDTDKYTVPRNKNIKAIYIMLASKQFFANDCMINKEFYEKCKYKTMTTLNAAADKAKGILGSSFAVGLAGDLADSVNSSAYKYTKKIEKYLLDPKTNINGLDNATNITFDQDNLDNIGLPEDLQGVLKNVELTASYSSGSATSSDYPEVTYATDANPAAIEEQETKRKSSITAEKETADAVRFAQSIPMVVKRDLIIKYLDIYYTLCAKYGIDEESELQPAFGNLTYYVFGTSIRKGEDLYTSLLSNSTNASLTRNIQTLISIQKTESLESITNISSSVKKGAFINIYNLIINALNLEISVIGLNQMTFNYDKEHISSLFKQYFNNKLDYIKSINDKNNSNYKTFYIYKDAMTKCFKGFDRNGVFGYSDEKERLRYTNIETGDWRAIHYSSKNGTFFAGSDNTNGNGIMKLNEAIEELMPTNITSGNWKSILEFNNVVFFINDNNTIYYWDGSNVVKTNITDYDKWEFDAFKEYDIIFLKGLNNNGIKYWNGSSFISITETGDKWVYESLNHNNYYILYPSRSVGNVYYFKQDKVFSLANVSGSVTSFVTTLPKLTYTLVEQVAPETGGEGDTGSSAGGSSSEGGAAEPQEIRTPMEEYEFHIIIATKSNGVWDSYTTHSTSSIFELTTNQSKQISNFDSSKINILYKNNNDEGKCYCHDGSNIYLVTLVSTKDGGEMLPTISDIVENKVSQQTLSGCRNTNTQITKLGVFLNIERTSGSDVSNEIWYFDKNSNDVAPVKVADRSMSGIDFFIGQDNKRTFGKSSNNYYLLVSNSSLNQLLSDNDVKEGWILQYTNNSYYLVNHTNSLGIKQISNNAAVNTNITSGFWNVTSSGTKVFALSIKNTNKGIKCSSLGGISNFVDIAKSPYKYQDVYGYSYNPSRKILYFGSCRDELLLDIDHIVYNIDAYIYTLTAYQMKQQLNELVSSTGTAKMDKLLSMNIEDLIEKEKLTESERNSQPNKYITYFYKDENGNWVAVSGITFFDESKTYYMMAFDRIINDYNKDLLSQINAQRELEKASALYSDLTTYAEALTEFDIDDEKNKESLLLSMINEYDYKPTFGDEGPIFVKVSNNNTPDPNIQYYTKDGGNYIACEKPLLKFELGVDYYIYITEGDTYIKVVDGAIPDPNTQYYTKDSKGIYHSCPMPLLKFDIGVDYYMFNPNGIDPNMNEKFLSKISYTTMIRKMTINTLYEKQPGESEEAENVGSFEWNVRNNHMSDDFLNSDENFVNYTHHT